MPNTKLLLYTHMPTCALLYVYVYNVWLPVQQAIDPTNATTITTTNTTATNNTNIIETGITKATMINEHQQATKDDSTDTANGAGTSNNSSKCKLYYAYITDNIVYHYINLICTHCLASTCSACYTA
jgi:hypothetical protein